MTEQMQKLAEQAGFCHDINHGIYLCSPMHIQKFAELIVRECCGVLTENVEVALNASGSPVYPEGLICEHFGVGE